MAAGTALAVVAATRMTIVFKVRMEDMFRGVVGMNSEEDPDHACGCQGFT